MSPLVLQALGWTFCTLGLAWHVRRFLHPQTVEQTPVAHIDVTYYETDGETYRVKVEAHPYLESEAVAVTEGLSQLTQQAAEQVRQQVEKERRP